MPTTRYNKQQICGILLQFGAGLGSGGSGVCREPSAHGGIPGRLEHGESPGSHPVLAGGFLFPFVKCKTPLFTGRSGCDSSDDLFYRGAISSHFFVQQAKRKLMRDQRAPNGPLLFRNGRER